MWWHFDTPAHAKYIQYNKKKICELYIPSYCQLDTDQLSTIYKWCETYQYNWHYQFQDHIHQGKNSSSYH